MKRVWKKRKDTRLSLKLPITVFCNVCLKPHISVIIKEKQAVNSKEEENKIKEDAPQPAIQKSYFLQVGAFQTEVEADNMKAKLALQGFEAIVQTAAIPDKGVWHRVRVGPLKDLDQINKTKSELVNNGFKADLIKVNNENQ